MVYESEFYLGFPYPFTYGFITDYYKKKHSVDIDSVHIHLSENVKIGSELQEGDIIGYISPEKNSDIPTLYDMEIIMPTTAIITQIHTDKYKYPIDSYQVLLTIGIEGNSPKQQHIATLCNKMVAHIYLDAFEYGVFNYGIFDFKNILKWSSICLFLSLAISLILRNFLPIIALFVIGWIFYKKIYMPARKERKDLHDGFIESQHFDL